MKIKQKLSQSPAGEKVLSHFEKRLRVAHRSEQTIGNYTRNLKNLMDFHLQLPDQLDIDQVIDYLNYLKEDCQRNLRTIKIYAASFRWYYLTMISNFSTFTLITTMKKS
ncbi:MAG: phage integrase N-terminal SAM-like domain-containing protein [Candidatus Cyclobacteriaceae bacterium M3_2C_046]